MTGIIFASSLESTFFGGNLKTFLVVTGFSIFLSGSINAVAVADHDLMGTPREDGRHTLSADDYKIITARNKWVTMLDRLAEAKAVAKSIDAIDDFLGISEWWERKEILSRLQTYFSTRKNNPMALAAIKALGMDYESLSEAIGIGKELSPLELAALKEQRNNLAFAEIMKRPALLGKFRSNRVHVDLASKVWDIYRPLEGYSSEEQRDKFVKNLGQYINLDIPDTRPDDAFVSANYSILRDCLSTGLISRNAPLIKKLLDEDRAASIFTPFESMETSSGIPHEKALKLIRNPTDQNLATLNDAIDNFSKYRQRELTRSTLVDYLKESGQSALARRFEVRGLPHEKLRLENDSEARAELARRRVWFEGEMNASAELRGQYQKLSEDQKKGLYDVVSYASEYHWKNAENSERRKLDEEQLEKVRDILTLSARGNDQNLRNQAALRIGRGAADRKSQEESLDILRTSGLLHPQGVRDPLKAIDFYRVNKEKHNERMRTALFRPATRSYEERVDGYDQKWGVFKVGSQTLITPYPELYREVYYKMKASTDPYEKKELLETLRSYLKVVENGKIVRPFSEPD